LRTSSNISPRLLDGVDRRSRPEHCVPRADPYPLRATVRRFMTIASPCSIESPCNRVCTVDPGAALCVGCGRSLAEIAGWLGFSTVERRRIMAELPRRIAALAVSGAERP
jgi:uncharacterized protein